PLGERYALKPSPHGFLRQNESEGQRCVRKDESGKIRLAHTRTHPALPTSPIPGSFRSMPQPACSPRPAPENIAETAAASPCEPQSNRPAGFRPRPPAPGPLPTLSLLPPGFPSSLLSRSPSLLHC